MTRQDPTNDPRWARLIDLVTGELPPEEAEALRRWVDADPERREALAQTEAIWRATDVSAELDAMDGEAELRRIKAEAGGGGRVIARVGPTRDRGPSLETAHGRRSRLGVAIRIAAAVVLIAGGGVLWRIRSPAPIVAPSAPVAMAEYRTAPGERLSLRLPDGTQVMLAPGGVLRRPSDYGARNRHVELEGEAYFAVAHDSTRPFTVATGHAVTRVLGTRFVVRAYPDEPATDVVVAEGRVAVRRVRTAGMSAAALGSADSLILTPRERATITAAGALQLTRGVALERYLGWTEGRLAFENTPLREVVRKLGRWYGIEIRLADPSLGDRRLTATLRNEAAPQALDLVASALRLTVTRSHGAYVLGNARR